MIKSAIYSAVGLVLGSGNLAANGIIPVCYIVKEPSFLMMSLRVKRTLCFY